MKIDFRIESIGDKSFEILTQVPCKGTLTREANAIGGGRNYRAGSEVEVMKWGYDRDENKWALVKYEDNFFVIDAEAIDVSQD